MPKPLAVLIVEDSESDLKLILRLLKKAGYQVVSEQVETATQMRAALEKQAWDVVISDYSLPQFNGRAALTLLQEMGLDIPFIVVSGTIGEEIAVAMMKAGAHDYLMKGNLARLSPAIERELAQAVIRRESKQAVEALRESEEKYRTLVEQASDGIFVADSEGKHVEVNSRGCEMLGYTRAEILGLKISDLLKTSEMEGAPLRLDALRNGKTLLTERTLVRKNGSTFPTEVSVKMFPNGQLQAIVRDITERKRAEEQFHDSEERFRTTFEQAAVGIAHVSTEGGWLKVNQRLCDIVGYTRDELHALTFQDITHPDDLQTDLSYVQQMLADEIKTYSMEKRYIRKDRSIVWINLTVSLVRETSGEPKYFISVVEDITERKRTEEALRKHEEYLTQLMSTLGDAVLTIRYPGRQIEYVNRAATGIFGYTSEEMIGQTTRMLYMDDAGYESFGEILQDMLAQGRNEARTELELRHKDGRTVWAEEQTTLLFQEEQLPASISVLRDITERKQAEEEITKLSNAVEQSADIIFITDRDGMIEYVNPAFETITGYSKAESIGKSPRILASGLMQPEYYQRTWATILSGEVFRSEVIDRKKNGEIFYYDQTITPLKDAHGNVTHFVSTGRDVTERKQAEEALRKKEEHHKAVIESIFKFVPEGVLVLTESLNLLKQNKAFDDIVQKYAPMLGYSEQELADEIIEQLRSNILSGDTTEIHIQKKSE